jgi:flagellar P-ring protein FlgI
MRRSVQILGLWLLCHSLANAQVRIKDITSVEGVRTNQLTGLGLVSGLAGTGGRSPITRQLALNFQQRYGLRADSLQRLNAANDTKQKTDNLSVVAVTAQLPVFAKEGSTIDVTVSAWDDAKSLLGGTLMLTPLSGADGCVYAVAQGPISVGGFSFDGQAASVQQNHPTTGRITGGAIVEEAVPYTLGTLGHIRLLLNQADFVTANRVADAINQVFPGVAANDDSGTIKLLIPPEYTHDAIGFLSQVQSLPVQPDTPARVVINERTGTVVVGQQVRISAVAITHANLTVLTTETPQVSQPAPLSQGVTTVVPRSTVDVVQEKRPMYVLPANASVGDLAAALNVLGVTPRDLSAIFQQLHAAGALHAELQFQ